jgi:exosortase E/protease (VPEID-CTERM system)
MNVDSVRAATASLRRPSLAARLAIAAVVLLLEKSVLNLFVDFDLAQRAHGFGAELRAAQHWGFRFLVSLVIALFLFGWLSGRRELAEVDEAGRGARLRFGWLAIHVLLVVPLAPLSMTLYSQTTHLPLAAVVPLWVLFAALAGLALFAALAPYSLWARGARAVGALWGYSLIAAAGSVAVMGASQSLWSMTARLTFEAVYRLLAWFIPTLEVHPAELLIDTGRFAVTIDPVCSGLEGVGLMLAFCIALLLLFRKEFIFPRALLLVPAGLLLSFALNVVRIALLVAIGDAGYVGVAVYGFHSQAGWIAFNAAAAAVALISLRSGWLTRVDHASSAAENHTAVYLLPFLGLLAAAMVSRAASSGVETFYWLRLAGVGLAMLYSWPRLRGVVWRCTWRGLLAGALAFVLWTVAAWAMGRPADPSLVLPDASPLTRASWLIARLAVSLIAVPVAEELAFRAYLLRRFVAPDFESVSPGAVGVWPLLLSSVVFGVAHGALWLPGTLSGLVFGLLYMRTRLFGEAVAAHATANVLVALIALRSSFWG